MFINNIFDSQKAAVKIILSCGFNYWPLFLFFLASLTNKEGIDEEEGKAKEEN